MLSTTFALVVLPVVFSATILEDDIVTLLQVHAKTKTPACAGIEVQSVDHVQGIDGKYFNFNKDRAELLLERQMGSMETWNVQCLAHPGQVTEVTVWNQMNGGTIGEAHGRLSVGAAEGDWQAGDCLVLIDECDGISVLSTDHVSGTLGKYFNFDKANAEEVLGHQMLVEEDLRVQVKRTGEETVVKVWNQDNGGSDGDAHGRLSVSAAQGNWQVGDCLTVLNVVAKPNRCCRRSIVNNRGGCDGCSKQDCPSPLSEKGCTDADFLVWCPR